VGQAIGTVLPLALGVAISPIPIIAVVVTLASPRSKLNGLAFVLGWVVGMAVMGTIALLVADGISASNSGQPKTWVSVLKLVLGLLLVVVAARGWRGRPRGEAEPPLPGWMQRIDAFGPVHCAGLAAALAGNPKNLMLTVAAGAAIAQAGVAGGEQAIVMAIFVVLATLGAGVPLGITYALGQRSAEVLARLRGWMVYNTKVIVSVLCLLIGAKLIGDAIGGLAA
jgi:threonine/homoserine/homoserine lactone efflux protein